MMKPFMLGTALSALMLSSALAQSSMSPPKTNPAPVAPAQSSSKADVDRSQKTDQWLLWSLDTAAIGSDDKNIGDLIPGQNGFVDQLKVSQNKDELKQAKHFTPYGPQPATTGMGPSMPLRGYGPFPPLSPAATPPAGQ